MTVHMMVDLEQAVTALEAWPGVAVLIRGEGLRAFCSGGHLADVQEALLDPAAGERMTTFMQEVLERLSRLPLLTVAVVEGVALGGGAELLTACDFIFASEPAEIGFVQAKLGLSTGWGGGTRLTERIGPRAALDWLVFPTVRPARSALAVGWVYRVCPQGQALLSARSWLGPLEALSADAVRAMIQNVRQVVPSGHEASLAGERERFISLWGGAAHRAALKRLLA
jgi:ethylmalonyl-CoA/methylmalonyl-CoA decarboxylase